MRRRSAAAQRSSAMAVRPERLEVDLPGVARDREDIVLDAVGGDDARGRDLVGVGHAIGQANDLIDSNLSRADLVRNKSVGLHVLDRQIPIARLQDDRSGIGHHANDVVVRAAIGAEEAEVGCLEL